MMERDNFQPLDFSFPPQEQLPAAFVVEFKSIATGPCSKTKVMVNGEQIGDVISDNSREDDGYRFHDVFHYVFAAYLGWSPCVRAMMKRKRKSSAEVDEVEDGARAIIAEEAISLILFSEAKKADFYRDANRVSPVLLQQIKDITHTLEVSIRNERDWEEAILTGYALFRQLLKNDGGKIRFDRINQTAEYFC